MADEHDPIYGTKFNFSALLLETSAANCVCSSNAFILYTHVHFIPGAYMPHRMKAARAFRPERANKFPIRALCVCTFLLRKSKEQRVAIFSTPHIHA